MATKQLKKRQEQPKNDDKYLKYYAEPDAALASWWAERRLGQHVAPSLDRVLLIPVYAERANLEGLLSSAADAAAALQLRVLVVLVLNQRCDAPAWVQDDNAACSREWRDKLAALSTTCEPVPAFCGSWQGLELLFVERLEAAFAFPPKQGVGLARKIGGDIAYALYRLQALRCGFACTSDGDALLPLDYFASELGGKPGQVAAVLHPFIHRAPAGLSDAQKQAMELYDAYLRYYCEGLKQAGSPYAYIPVGSTITFNLQAYGQVRGFPRIEAGEDFYFLNKLRKVGAVIDAKGEPISLQGRVSARVPFGTGQAIAAISQKLVEEKPYLVYHPAVFRVLKVFLDGVGAYCEHGDFQTLVRGWDHVLPQALQGLPQGLAQEGVSSFNGAQLEKLVEQLGGASYLLSLPVKARAPEQRRQHFNCWFDAFKTLKFIHLLRESYFYSLPFPLTRLS